MEIKYGNLILRTLTENDLEKVRTARNHNWVNNFLMDRQHISKEMQVKWFKQIQWESQHYWIMSSKQNDIGIIYLSNWQIDTQSANSNLFLFEEHWSGHPDLIRAVWLITFLCFYGISCEKLTSTVNNGNTNALEIDKYIGFSLLDTHSDFLQSVCTRDSFYRNSQAILKLFFKKEHSLNIHNCNNAGLFAPLRNWENRNIDIYSILGL